MKWKYIPKWGIRADVLAYGLTSSQSTENAVISRLPSTEGSSKHIKPWVQESTTVPVLSDSWTEASAPGKKLERSRLTCRSLWKIDRWEKTKLGRLTTYVLYNGSFVGILHCGVWGSVLCNELALSLPRCNLVTCLKNEQISALSMSSNSRVLSYQKFWPQTYWWARRGFLVFQLSLLKTSAGKYSPDDVINVRAKCLLSIDTAWIFICWLKMSFVWGVLGGNRWEPGKKSGKQCFPFLYIYYDIRLLGRC